MKPFLQATLTLMLLLVLGTGVRAQNTEWTDVTPAGFGEAIIEIVTPAPDAYYAISYTSFLKSTDGGLGWWTYHINGVATFDIAFLNRDTGYFVGMASGGIGIIGRTTDGGIGWSTAWSGSNMVVTGIEFYDAQNGLASATNGTILKTTDGGQTWNAYGPQTNEFHFQKISFPTATTAFAVAMASGGEPNKVFKSTDAGLTWAKVYDNGTDYTKPIFYGIDFVNATTGWAAGHDVLRKIWKTTDGGVTWARQFEMPGPTTVAMRNVEMLTDSIGFAVGDRGKVLRTVTGGTVWFQEAPPTDSSLYAIGMINPTLGFFGGNTILLKREVTYDPTIQVNPDNLDFGAMTTGSKELSFTISPSNPAPLTVRSLRVVDSQTSGFEIVSPAANTLPVTLDPGQSLTVTVRFTPRANLNALIFAGVDVSTDDPRTPVKQVILKADTRTGEPDFPQLSISQSTLEFGQVYVDSTKTLSFTVGTANKKALKLDTLFIIAGNTAPHGLRIVAPVGGYPITIPPDTPLTVTVRFAPTQPVGEIDANLVVRTNDPDNPEIMLLIQGEALEAPTGVDEFFLPKWLDLR